MNTLKFELTDRHNSLQKYNFFLKNIGVEEKLEEMIAGIVKENGHAKILDIGCGDGGALKELKQVFGEKVIVCGVDALEAQGLDWFEKKDAAKAVLPKNCDLVVSFRSLHEIAHLKKVFEKISESLAAGGMAILSIRCEQEVGKKILLHGNLEKKDLDFLKKIKKQEQFNGLKALIIDVFQQTSAGEILSGVNVFLHKI